MKKLISMVLVLALLSVVFAAAGMAATLRGTVRTPTSDGTVYVRTQAGEGKPGCRRGPQWGFAGDSEKGEHVA